MTQDEENAPYAGPGRETTPRRDMPEDHEDVREFVEEVDEVPEEHLETRIDETSDETDEPS